MRWFFALSCLIIGSIPMLARAEGPPRAIALAEALDLAAKGGPASRTASAQLASSRTELGVASVIPNPKLTVGTTTTGPLLNTSLVVYLPVFGQVSLARDAARAVVATREAAAKVARSDAQLAAALAWTDLWLAESERAIAESDAARSARVAAIARTREDEGSSPHLDVLRADSDAARALADAEALATLVRASEARLSVALGADADVTHWATAGEPFRESDVPARGGDDAAILAHPMMTVAAAALREADANAARIGRARFPLLQLQLGGSFFNQLPPPQNDLQVAVAFELPLFDGPFLSRAEAQRTVAVTNADLTRLDVSARMIAARAEAVAAIGRARALAEKVMPAAEAAAALSVEAYETGALDLTSVLVSEQALAQARLARARADAERGRAIARLRYATGAP